MRKIRVCIYGGTDLQKTPAEFIAALSYRILDSLSAVIVTGGFLRSNAQPDAISTDAAALAGARRYAEAKSVALQECFEAWIPQPQLDQRPEIQNAVRMSEKDGVTVRVMVGRTPLGRRLAMVAGVDLVVTISGKQHTRLSSSRLWNLACRSSPFRMRAATPGICWRSTERAFPQTSIPERLIHAWMP